MLQIYTEAIENMKIIKLRKRGLACACGCKRSLARLDLVNKMNGKHYRLHCAKVYRLHTSSIRWIKEICFNAALQDMS